MRFSLPAPSYDLETYADLRAEVRIRLQHAIDAGLREFELELPYLGGPVLVAALEAETEAALHAAGVAVWVKMDQRADGAVELEVYPQRG